MQYRRDYRARICPRPMTHRLMASMLRGLGVEIERIVISDIVDDTIFATITLRNGEIHD